MSSKKASAKKRLTAIAATDAGWTGQHFLTTGFADYIGARVMLNNDLPLQGVVLASTCVEKYLKAILSSVGKQTPTHLDSPDFLEVMGMYDLGIESYISTSFLEYLGRAYQFRYIGARSGPVSIGVETRKLLAELDYTVEKIESSIVARKADGSILHSSYKRAVDAKDPRVILNNFVLNAIDKTLFVEEAALIYGAFVAPLGEFLEMTHPRWRATNNSSFDKPTFHAEGHHFHMEFGAPAAGRFV